MRGVVISINKEKREVILLEKMQKKRVKLSNEEIKKIMLWDQVVVEENRVIIEKRAKPISVSKAAKLMNYIEKGVITSIYGKAEKGFLYDLANKDKIKILSNNFLEGEVIIENALINKEGVSLLSKSRVFRKIQKL